MIVSQVLLEAAESIREAISPEDLQNILREAIDSAIDAKVFNDEIDQEKNDAAYLATTRKSVHKHLADLAD